MPEADYYIKQNDKGLRIADVLKNEDLDPVDIAGAAIKFHMAPIQGGVPVIAGSASNDQVTDGTGAVSYAFGTADTDTPGLYLAEWQVTYAVGGAIQSFPNGAHILIRVFPQVA